MLVINFKKNHIQYDYTLIGLIQVFSINFTKDQGLIKRILSYIKEHTFTYMYFCYRCTKTGREKIGKVWARFVMYLRYVRITDNVFVCIWYVSHVPRIPYTQESGEWDLLCTYIHSNPLGYNVLKIHLILIMYIPRYTCLRRTWMYLTPPKPDKICNIEN